MVQIFYGLGILFFLKGLGWLNTYGLSVVGLLIFLFFFAHVYMKFISLRVQKQTEKKEEKKKISEEEKEEIQKRLDQISKDK